MNTDQFNHAPAELFVHTGNRLRRQRGPLGSWITYGLGSENQDLPGFVVLLSGGTDPTGGKACGAAGFLPSVYQGVQLPVVGRAQFCFPAIRPAWIATPAARRSTYWHD